MIKFLNSDLFFFLYASVAGLFILFCACMVTRASMMGLM